MPAITIDYLNDVLRVCRENQVTEFKTKDLEFKLGFGVPSAKIQDSPHWTVPAASNEPTEPIELTEDMPSDDELLFGASGFAVNRE
jgi:hypothetical protein